MGRLLKADVGVAPLFLMYGKPAKEQLTILYLWAHALTGTEWTFSRIKEMAGCNVNRELLDKMVEDKLLGRVPESERKTTKPCHEYYVDTDMVPDRVEKVPVRTHKDAHYPSWVWRAMKIWKEHQGIVGPQRMQGFLSPAVKEHGEETVMAGLEKYAIRADKKFLPSPDKFVRNIVTWINVDNGREFGGQDMSEMT